MILDNVESNEKLSCEKFEIISYYLSKPEMKQKNLNVFLFVFVVVDIQKNN